MKEYLEKLQELEEELNAALNGNVFYLKENISALKNAILKITNLKFNEKKVVEEINKIIYSVDFLDFVNNRSEIIKKAIYTLKKELAVYMSDLVLDMVLNVEKTIELIKQIVFFEKLIIKTEL